MRLGLALVAGQRGTLGDFPSLGSYFLEWSTDGSTVAPSVTCTIRKMMNAHDMHVINMQKGTKLSITGPFGAIQTKQQLKLFNILVSLPKRLHL